MARQRGAASLRHPSRRACIQVRRNWQPTALRMTPRELRFGRLNTGRWDALEALGIGLFGPSSARCPVADDTQRSSEAARRQTAPEFSAVAAVGGPLLVEPWQMSIQETLPCPEDIVAFAANYLPNQLPAVPGLARDLLNCHSAFRQPQDRSVRLFAAQVALVLDALGRRQQLGVHPVRADDVATGVSICDGIEVAQWRSTDANDPRPARHAAGPWPQPRRIRHHGRGR